MLGNGFVRELAEEFAAPVVVHSGSGKPVEHALQHRKGHRADELEDGRSKRAGRCEDVVGTLGRPRVAPDDSADSLEMQILRKRGTGRNDEEGEDAGQLIRPVSEELVVHTQRLSRAVERPQHRSCDDRLDRVQTERE